jgi:hypothetical protein
MRRDVWPEQTPEVAECGSRTSPGRGETIQAGVSHGPMDHQSFDTNSSVSTRPSLYVVFRLVPVNHCRCFRPLGPRFHRQHRSSYITYLRHIHIVTIDLLIMHNVRPRWN